MALSPLALAIGLAVAPAVHAGPTIQLGEDTSLAYSLTLSHTLSSRIKKADKAYLADPNSDDGTRNFDRGSLFTNRTNALGELRLRHDNLGAMLRASTFYDAAYRNSNDNNSPATVNKIGPHDEFTAITRRDSGRNSRILDAYVYGNFAIGEEQYLSLKAGRHVLAWGESLFWPNISQGQSPADAPVFNVPGTEAKEGYMPVGQLSGTFTFNDKLSVTGFYQYKWEKTRLNAVGDYFGSDFFGPGAQFYRLAPGVISSLPDSTFTAVNFGGEIEPGDSGQWGVGGRYQVSDATEVGLYHYRYHDRVGAMFFDFSGDTTYSSFARFGSQASPAGAPYFKLAYFDDIKLTGVSFSSKIGDAVQYAAELSYRDNAPVYVNTPLGPAPARGSYFQGNLNAIYMLGPSKLAHQTTLMGELVHQRIHSVEDLAISVGKVNIGSFNDYTYDTQTRGSTLLGVGGIFDYPSVFPGWDLSTKAIWTQNIAGSAYSGMGRDERRLTLGADFKYLGNFSVGLTYVDYLSSASVKNGRNMADRDYVSLNAKYTF
ncbi:DUF1302 domain-containing protein [Thauera terpenica]